MTVTDYLVCNEQVTSQAGNPALVAAAQQQGSYNYYSAFRNINNELKSCFAETKNVQERYVCKEQPNGELDCKPAPP